MVLILGERGGGSGREGEREVRYSDSGSVNQLKINCTANHYAEGSGCREGSPNIGTIDILSWINLSWGFPSALHNVKHHPLALPTKCQ